MESSHGGHSRAVPLTTEGGLLSCERSWLTLERKTPREGRLLSGLGRRRSQPEWRVSAAQVCIQDMCEGQTRTEAFTLEPPGQDLMGKAGTPPWAVLTLSLWP